MMDQAIFPELDDSNQYLDAVLVIDGRKVNLIIHLRWCEVIGKWLMSVADSEGNDYVRNIPVLRSGGEDAGNLLRQLAYKRIGSAYIIPTVEEPSTENPDFDNFCKDNEFALVWGDTP